MNHKPLSIAFLAITPFVMGCKPPAEPAPGKTPETTAQQFDQVRKETKEAVQEMNDYAYAQKVQFVEKMQGQLDEINRDLAQLAAKVDKSTDAAKAEAKPKLDALRDQTAKLTKQLDTAKMATESTWDEVKAGLKQGYGELKDGFNQARQWTADKIAP